jgi:DNA-binding ferritin-like protein
MKKRLIESLEAQQVIVNANASMLLDTLVHEWTGIPYAELSVVVVLLKSLATLHQSYHWITKGDSFYGDHLLFMRMYESVSGEIDTVAEKAVGVGCVENVNVDLQARQTTQVVSQMNASNQTIPHKSDLLKKAYVAELCFLQCVAHAALLLKEQGLLTRGIDNMLAGIEDNHESHCYLLKQALSADTF